jgi:violaxanthin de-epoxidase
MATALVEPFSTDEFKGTWYISAGLNKDFDCFDCQVHKFEVPGPGKLKGNMQWRIKDPVAGTNFVTRATIQEFVQDEKSPGVLYNRDNEFLHYQDDWYVLAYKPREYVLVYYRGSNDAWDGYGGAVVYTTAPTLDKKYYKEIDDALQRIGRKFSDFTINDNSCRARESRLEELEADVQFVEARFGTSLQMPIQRVVKAVEDEAEVIEKAVEKEAQILENEAEKDVSSTLDFFQRKLLGGNRPLRQ